MTQDSIQPCEYEAHGNVIVKPNLKWLPSGNNLEIKTCSVPFCVIKQTTQQNDKIGIVVLNFPSIYSLSHE